MIQSQYLRRSALPQIAINDAVKGRPSPRLRRSQLGKPPLALPQRIDTVGQQFLSAGKLMILSPFTGIKRRYSEIKVVSMRSVQLVISIQVDNDVVLSSQAQGVSNYHHLLGLVNIGVGQSQRYGPLRDAVVPKPGFQRTLESIGNIPAHRTAQQPNQYDAILTARRRRLIQRVLRFPPGVAVIGMLYPTTREPLRVI